MEGLVVKFLSGGTVYNGVAFLFAALGILGLPLTIYGLKSIKKRSPVFLIRNTSLVKNGVDGIKSVSVMYEAKKVPNLSVARIAFWNAGRETISFSDAAPTDPIQISAIEGVKILDARILIQSEPTNNFSVHLSSKQKHATITFDFIDHDQGVVLEIFHTGNSREDISITGTVKSCGKVLRMDDRPVLLKILSYFEFADKLKLRHKKNFVGIIMILTPIALWISEFANYQPFVASLLLRRILLAFISILYVSTGLSLLSKRAPKKLAVFQDEII